MFHCLSVDLTLRPLLVDSWSRDGKLWKKDTTGHRLIILKTQSTITIFIEAMISFPDIQKGAQEEIDRITEGNRLPEYHDQELLPYIQALIREVVRWRPLIPLGIAHANNEDDTYKGHYIPKGALPFSFCAVTDVGWDDAIMQTGSIVQANVWQVTMLPILNF